MVTEEVDRRAITVVGVGVVTGRPDLVLLTLGVETPAATPGEAMRSAATAAARLDRICSEQGVAETDRQTVHIGVQPEFDHVRQEVSGHRASHVVRLAIRDVEGAGRLVDAASADEVVGQVLRVHQLALSFADPEPLLETARARAVSAARGYAEQLAEAAGVGLGPLRSLSEGLTGSAYDVPRSGGYTLLAQSAAPVQPGTEELTVRVVATYEIVS